MHTPPYPGMIDGVSMRRQAWMPFEEAVEFVRALKLRSAKDWWAYTRGGKRPLNIPTNPHQAYAVEWNGFGHWLGTSDAPLRCNGGWLAYSEAKAFVQQLGLRSQKEWIEWAKTAARPTNIPANPHCVFKKLGWQGYGVFLGTGNKIGGIKGDWRAFEAAVEFARALRLTSSREWGKWRASPARPSDIPSDPRAAYGPDWRGYNHWLGIDTAERRRKWRSFDEAKKHARALRLPTRAAWQEWHRSGHPPTDIPADPRGVYIGKGWGGWADWLGRAPAKKRRRED